MIALLRVLYLAFFIVPTVADAGLALFLEAEAALQQSIEAAGRGGSGAYRTARSH
ncbi:hypothetical protein [Burkholderia ubonensis]|uniref:hypothetical protein n=1 Tax=Burkholderia ubonensis TaxID=101571 RepID=UPI000A9F310A|nr:hypothetical protein [Burkholderia ubonensis]